MMRLLLIAVLVLTTGCASVGGLVATNPTEDQTQAARRLAVRVADSVRAGLTIAHETGVILDTLPMAAERKDAYDCALLKVTGTSAPASATVLSVCGAVPLAAEAPLTVSLQTLAAVTTCANLRTTVTAILAVVTPLIQQLEVSETAALRMAGLSLRATFALLSAGGATC